MFQFQTGAIKSGSAILQLAFHLSFNSKLVRLKGHDAIIALRQTYSFNSKLVRLKAGISREAARSS